MPKLATRKSDVVFRNAKARDKPYQIADGGGLSLLVQPNGSKLWLFRYRRPASGRDNLISLGPYADLSPAEARLRASAFRKQVRDGIDPVEQRRADKASIKRDARGPFRVVAKEWLEFKRKGWADQTYRNAEYVVNEYLVPALKDRSIATLVTADVKPVLQSIATVAPTLASKARQYVGGIVTFAIQSGLREDGKLLALRGVVPNYEKGHIPAITRPSDIGPLVCAIDAYASPITRAALQLTMLTGLRPGVVAGVPWAEIDLDAAEWHVPAARMKMNHDHIVPLPTQAVLILERLRAHSGGGQYVFPSPARQKTPHLHRDALSKALRQMGFQGKHAAHGFRGMLRTVGRERLGMDLDVLEAQLAHAKRGDIQKAYDRTTFDDDRRRVMQAWADYIDRMRTNNKNVVELHQPPAA